MAEFIPEKDEIENYLKISINGQPNDGELKTLELLSNLSDDYTIIHSLTYITQYANRTVDGECDFIIIKDNNGILCLEVKGILAVNIKDNEWVNCNGDKIANPLEQARKMKDFLKVFFKKIFPDKRFPEFVLGHAAFLPFLEFNHIIPQDPDNICIIDKRYLKEDDFVRRIDKIFQYWQQKDRKGNIMFNREQFLQFKERLISNLYIKTDIHTVLDITSRQFVNIEEKTIPELAKLLPNRCIINGGAGTGKTYLAISKMNLLAEESPETKCLYICFNRCLTEFVKRRMNKAKAEIINIHKFIDNYYSDEYMLTEQNRNDLPDIQNLNAKNFYDAIFLDEAQDFNIEWIDFIAKHLNEYGKIWIMGDSEQNNYKKNFSEKFEEWAKNKLEIKKLKKNLRNAAPILKYMQNQTGFGKEMEPTINTDVAPEEINVFNKEDLINKINELYHNFLQLHNENKSFILLSNVTLEKLGLTDVKIYSAEIKEREYVSNKDKIGFYTIQAFKGLEADVVVYISAVNNNITEETLKLDYEAYSRAKSMLYVIKKF